MNRAFVMADFALILFNRFASKLPSTLAIVLNLLAAGLLLVGMGLGRRAQIQQ